MPGWHPFRSRFNQKAEYVEAIVLRQSRQNGDSVLFFHISNIIEIKAAVKRPNADHAAGARVKRN
jgi:hypothetical protein